MTRRDIVKNLCKLGLTKNQANAAVDTFFGKIVEALKEQKEVSIVGFGSWEWRQRHSRMARNPKTGKAVALGSRKALIFKPSQRLKNKLKD
jgi:integration host factor subunit alpha